MTASASAQAAPEVSLTRLDCGTPNPPTDVSIRFTDIYGHQGLKIPLVLQLLPSSSTATTTWYGTAGSP